MSPIWRKGCLSSVLLQGEESSLCRVGGRGVLERSDCSQSRSDCPRVGASVYVLLSIVLARSFLSSFSRDPKRMHEVERERHETVVDN